MIHRWRHFAAAALLCACTPAPTLDFGRITELSGRVASTPQKCVPFRANQALRRSEGDGHTLLYGSGRTTWVNYLGRTCGFRSTDTLVVDPAGSYLCRGEVIRSFDAASGIPGPSCVLGDFVPYIIEG